jgi:ubiquinone/menaquinone biosynthesis C-methylase UbiE
MGTDGYNTNLSAERRARCYDLAPDRIHKYLAAESAFVRSFIDPFSMVPKIGCGYGRFMKVIWNESANTNGIDLSFNSLVYGKIVLSPANPTFFFQMHALKLDFRSRSFDVVLCTQKGICAFNLEAE